MENKFEVRNLTAADMPSFLLAAKTFFYESYHRENTLDLDAFMNLILQSFAMDTVEIPTVFDLETQTVAGYAIINWNQEFKLEREGDMAEMYVRPDYRGTPVARLLAQAVIDQFDAWGCVSSHLWAAPGLDDQETALAKFRNLWSKYGYRQTGIIMSRKKGT